MQRYKNYEPPVNRRASQKHEGQMSAADKTKLDGMVAILTVNGPLYVSAGALGINLDPAVLRNDGSNRLGIVTPFPVDNLRVGNHPVHGSSYPGIWNAANVLGTDYALLAHASQTNINAPSGGHLYGLVGNVVILDVTTSGLVITGALTTSGNALIGTSGLFNAGIHPGQGWPALWYTGNTAAANYSLMYTSANTYLNAPTGGVVSLRVNNAESFYADANGLAIPTGKVVKHPGAANRTFGGVSLWQTPGGGYNGFAFHDAAGTYVGTLMGNNQYQGWYNEVGGAWRWLWDTGVLSAGTVPYSRLSGVGSAATFNAASALVAGTVMYRDGGGNIQGIVSVAPAAGTSTNNWMVNDILTYRSASTSTGVIYLGNLFSRYLFFDGTNYILAGASLVVNGTTYASSAEYKTGIAALQDTGLSRLRKLTPKLFAYKDNPNDKKIGFIYEDVVTQEPTFGTIGTGANGEEIKSLDYTSVFTLNVKATQELAATVDALTARVAALEALLLPGGRKP